jgi:hypothetical protein
VYDSVRREVTNCWFRIISRFIWIFAVITTVSHFTILQHINFTFDCTGPLLSGVFFTVPHLFIWPFTVCKLSQPFSWENSLLTKEWTPSWRVEFIRSWKHLRWLVMSYNWLPKNWLAVFTQLPQYSLPRKSTSYVCVVVWTCLIVTLTMIQETWLPSRCLAMDGRSNSDIPAFSGTSHCSLLKAVRRE